jgi:hypothetical protein
VILTFPNQLVPNVPAQSNNQGMDQFNPQDNLPNPFISGVSILAVDCLKPST